MQVFSGYKLKLVVVVFAFAFIVNMVNAQDAHFSQYSYTPLNINPAMTGVFDGTVRVSNSYRSQWSGLGNGFKTLHLSVDAPIGKGQLKHNFFGVGFMLYQDKAGEAGFKTTVMDASLCYTTAMDDQLENYFSIGFQAGLNQNSIDLNKATWDSQWNGDAFDPTLPSRDGIQLPQKTYVDLNAGLLYYYVPDGSNSFNVGASLSHIGSPSVSFYTLAETPLRQRLTAHTSAEIALDEERTAWIIPKMLYMKQGNQQEYMLGGYFRNKVQFKSRYTNYMKEAYFYGGAFYRWKDAFIVAARFEYNTLGLGISYDINASTLSDIAGASNAFEVNLSYVAYIKKGTRARNFNKMPRFF